MADRKPLSDDDIEALLNEQLRQLSEARFVLGAETEEGAEDLRIGSVGLIAALMRISKRQIKGPDDA